MSNEIREDREIRTIGTIGTIRRGYHSPIIPIFPMPLPTFRCALICC